VTDILTDYATERGPKVVAGDRIAYAVEALTPFWEGNTVVHVTRETCEAYAKHRAIRPARGKRKARALSPGTARRELGVLAAAINHAHREGRITRLVTVFLPERPESKDRWLTRKEAAALLRASRTPQARLYMPLFILTGLYTGRRKEAILSLRWPQVDLDAGLIHFDNPGRRLTKKRRGTVRVPPRLLPHLRRARRRGTDLGHVIHADGHRIGDIKKAFAGACSRAGLTALRRIHCATPRRPGSCKRALRSGTRPVSWRCRWRRSSGPMGTTIPTTRARPPRRSGGVRGLSAESSEVSVAFCVPVLRRG
jgi:integrase